MQVAVICNAIQKEELCSEGIQPDAALLWLNDSSELPKTDVVIDLLFSPSAERITLLKQASGVLINSVVETLEETDPSFVRINGWTSFLKGRWVEAAGNEKQKQMAETVFSIFHKSIEWLPDEPGFVTPRVVSAIINEAYFAWQEGVSSKAEIDTAMKLGTAYPLGPFEWSEKIGLKNIATLLQKLSISQSRYAPCSLLIEEAAI